MAESGPSYAEARKTLISNTTSVRIYGVPLEGADEGDSYHVFLFCGWALGSEERLEPTDRILRLKKGEVSASGQVPGFEHRGHDVHWYEVDLGAHLVEEMYLSIPISHLVPLRLGIERAAIPVTIRPDGPRPTQSPPGTVEPDGPRPTGAPPGTITP
jgi:hypothetical protein